MVTETVLVLRAEPERAVALEVLRKETGESSDDAAVWKAVAEYPRVRARMGQAQREVRRLRRVLARLAEVDPAEIRPDGDSGAVRAQRWREMILAER